MGTLTGVGMSHHRHTNRAAQEAVDKALTAAGITQPDFVFIFATLGYDPEKLVQTVRQATGHCALAGCSGQGVIVQGEADESNFAVAVMVIKSDELCFTNRMVSRGDQDFEWVGETLGSKLQMVMPHDPIALFLFTDGLSLNFDRLAHGLQSSLQLATPLPILGGAAGSDTEMRVTYQFCDDRVVTDGVVATLMSGHAQIAWAVNHGCVPIGTEYTITRAADNQIYELNNQPVFDVLREYLSDEDIDRWDRTIVSFCFGLQSPEHKELMIRYLPRKDESAGAVMLQTEVKEGTKIWVMRRDPEKIFQGAKQLASDLKTQLNGQAPKFVLHFDCYGRGSKSLLAEHQKQQLLDNVQANIGTNISWLGFYSHGEIAPIGNQNAFHNYTLVLIAIY
jgi:hypothetical protein